ncbi:MAG: DUF2294 domain-containing protein [Prochloraceae cyanobacterium]|nr:DUF2294 domain-containing protein [Prochloraceae cyanobacterium]
MDTNKAANPTRGQLERTLSQRIQAFYKERIGHQPSKVTCQLFDEKLAIILEDSITNAEELLLEEGQKDLAKKVRISLDDAIKPKLITLIEEILEVEVTDLLSDSTLETSRTGTIAVLANTPEVRNPESIPKLKKKQ